jgi:hypothetical protein
MAEEEEIPITQTQANAGWVAQMLLASPDNWRFWLTSGTG